MVDDKNAKKYTCPCCGTTEVMHLYDIENHKGCHQCFNLYWGSKGKTKPWQNK